MVRIHETATITSKGQITLPKPIRQALGVDAGGKIVFDFNGKSITVSRADAEKHVDPAIGQFLALIEQDLINGKNVAALPADLAKSMKRTIKRQLDLSEEIQGDVDL